MRVGIALGSNLEPRTRELALARAWLRSLGSGVKFSGVYETEAVDCPEGSPAFLNQAAEMTWNGSLTGLLDLLQGYERSRGRTTVRRPNQARILDLDLLYADHRIWVSPRLRLPHPRMGARRFVLEPLAEICPERKIPGLPGTVRETAEWLLARGGEICRKIA